MASCQNALARIRAGGQNLPLLTHSPLPEMYVAFCSAIRQIGYSARTITRARRSATGQTAKQVLTERLVLEAKRLLVHTYTPAAAISTQLGFTEPTNFIKYFTRNTAQTPSAFRGLHRPLA